MLYLNQKIKNFKEFRKEIVYVIIFIIYRKESLKIPNKNLSIYHTEYNKGSRDNCNAIRLGTQVPEIIYR